MSSVQAALAKNKPTSVSVNGVMIARGAIAREMQNHPAAKPIAAWQQAARALVIRELLLQRARALGIKPEPIGDDEGRRETDDEALMRMVIEQEVAVPEPDDATCRRYYDNNRPRFHSPDLYEVSHILVAARAADASSFAEARAAAESLLAFVRNHPERFADMAREHSHCPSAAQGGNLGQITRGQTTPEFERAMIALAPGELSATPVATRYGFHIIRMDRKIEGRALPYELVAERIADYLRDSVTRRAQAQYVARLVSAAKIDGIELADAEALRVH